MCWLLRCPSDFFDAPHKNKKKSLNRSPCRAGTANERRDRSNGNSNSIENNIYEYVHTQHNTNVLAYKTQVNEKTSDVLSKNGTVNEEAYNSTPRFKWWNCRKMHTWRYIHTTLKRWRPSFKSMYIVCGETMRFLHIFPNGVNGSHIRMYIIQYFHGIKTATKNLNQKYKR